MLIFLTLAGILAGGTLLRITGRGNRPSLRFSIRPEKIATGAIAIIISDSEPRALPEGTEGDILLVNDG